MEYKNGYEIFIVDFYKDNNDQIWLNGICLGNTTGFWFKYDESLMSKEK